MILDQQWAQFFEAVSTGASISDAASHCGMSRESVYKKRDRDNNFAMELEKAILAPKLKAIHVLQKAMSEHWQVAAWWLERKYPVEFALKGKEVILEDEEIPKRMANRAHELLSKLEKKTDGKREPVHT